MKSFPAIKKQFTCKRMTSWIKPLNLMKMVRKLHDEIEPSFGTIHKLMQDRQELAKKKESLKFALKTNIFPSWLSLKFQCHINLPNPEDNDEFVKFWKDTQKTERQKTLKILTDYFESCIERKKRNKQCEE